MWLGREGGIRLSDILKDMDKTALGLSKEDYRAHIEWAETNEARGRVSRVKYDEDNRMYFIIMLFTACDGSPVIRYYPTAEEVEGIIGKGKKPDKSFREKGDDYLRKLLVF